MKMSQGNPENPRKPSQGGQPEQPEQHQASEQSQESQEPKRSQTPETPKGSQQTESTEKVETTETPEELEEPGEVDRIIKGPSLENLDKILNQLMEEEKYKKLISKLTEQNEGLLKEIIKAQIENLKTKLEGVIEKKKSQLEGSPQAQKLSKDVLQQFAEARVLEDYNVMGNIEKLLRLYLTLFLLNDKNLEGDDYVKKFIEEELTLEEIEYVVRVIEGKKVVFVITREDKKDKKDKITLELQMVDFRISEGWKIYLLKAWVEIKNLEKELKKYYKALLGKIKKLGGEVPPGFKAIDIDKIIKELSPAQIRAYIEYLKNLLKTLKEAEKESEETGKSITETKAWEKFVGGAKDTAVFLASLGLSGFLLWFALIGFFFPLWVIERLQKR